MLGSDHGTHYEDFSAGEPYGFGFRMFDREEIMAFGEQFVWLPWMGANGERSSDFGSGRWHRALTHWDQKAW